MSLLGILRNGVKVVDKVTKSLQATVSFERCTSSDLHGNLEFAEGVKPLLAIIDMRQVQVTTSAGFLSVSRAHLIFLDIEAYMAATAGHGVTTNDSITLPDGSTGPVLTMTGFIDAGTTHPVATEIYLG